jgi:hypothetical protein
MYVCYTPEGKIIGKHEKYSALCDLAFSEGLDSFSINPANDKYLFHCLKLSSLFKIFLQLGGNKEQFKSVEDLRKNHGRILMEVRELICGYPPTQINLFELEKKIGRMKEQD